MPPRPHVSLILALVAWCSVALLPPSASAQGGPWLALGDSFSSGEGIPAAVGPCQQAFGDETAARAWPAAAYESLRHGLGLGQLAFEACSGAVTDDAAEQIERAARGPGPDGPFTVVSLSLGGNNLRFSQVLRGCLDLELAWHSIADPGCNESEAELRARIDMLTGHRPIDPAELRGSVTLPALYHLVSRELEPGGRAVVAGYPQLIEDPRHWNWWRLRCEGILRRDAPLIRRTTDYLNEQTALAVAAADARYRSRGIRFHFLDIASGPYADAHSLCAEDEWITPLTAGITQPPLRLGRAFHPTQAGHDAVAAAVAELIR